MYDCTREQAGREGGVGGWAGVRKKGVCMCGCVRACAKIACECCVHA